MRLLMITAKVSFQQYLVDINYCSDAYEIFILVDINFCFYGYTFSSVQQDQPEQYNRLVLMLVENLIFVKVMRKNRQRLQ